MKLAGRFYAEVEKGADFVSSAALIKDRRFVDVCHFGAVLPFCKFCRPSCPLAITIARCLFK